MSDGMRNDPAVSREQAQWMTSVGIDLGTSTTKFIVSRLKISRASGPLSLPRYRITDRELVYRSGIYATPLKNEQEIDMEQTVRILEEEYRKADLRLSEIKSGAVIITGETANKRNAEQFVHYLAERSGDFVVATAGAELEAVLAGKGAGAEERSRHIQEVAANIDIGGGTANTAFFHRGRCVGTVTFHVGGRLLRIDSAGRITGISKALGDWLEAYGYDLEIGGRVSLAGLQDIADSLCRSMFDYLTGSHKDPTAGLLIVGNELRALPEFAELTVSGGIGDMALLNPPANLRQAARYGDFGPVLAQAVRKAAQSYPFEWRQPAETIRATVIGAGMQTTELSGSTVFVDASLLPVRNLPVLRLELGEHHLRQPELLRSLLQRELELGADWYSSGDDAVPPFAVLIAGLAYCSYSELQMLAEQLSEAYRERFPYTRILAVIAENDMAKALGHALHIRCGGELRILSIDQITAQHGDYLDLGEQLAGGMLPVIVKTLVFHDKAR
ncbi:ethanolamine ammonia-lyase reactivating factor EutA [Ferviditalea candida]|uniref:Ethanolamine ammonia-lyase reactivating factor EutA n=1 Tax=Ferviditalea candida TaxID=3108399 RepID=A0ABU5ZHB6_9BACL|nr:ethanolamine ammonia-lyase reactivating factor EutA [Paenibacillaceae bacterium T2]